MDLNEKIGTVVRCRHTADVIAAFEELIEDAND